MATLIIDDIESNEGIIQLATWLLTKVTSGESDDLTGYGTVHMRYVGDEPLRIDDVELDWIVSAHEEHPCLSDFHSPHCTCLVVASETDVRQRPLFEAHRTPRGVEHQPCGRRGTHHSLVECWQCWSDVERGVIRAEEALAPEEVAG